MEKLAKKLLPFMVMTLGATILLFLCLTVAHAQVSYTLSSNGKTLMLENTFYKNYDHVNLGVTALSEADGWSIGYKVEPEIRVKKFLINPAVINSFGYREEFTVFITPSLSSSYSLGRISIGVDSKYLYNFNLQKGLFYHGITIRYYVRKEKQPFSR